MGTDGSGNVVSCKGRILPAGFGESYEVVCRHGRSGQPGARARWQSGSSRDCPSRESVRPFSITGELRRTLYGAESGTAEFFNPENARAQRLREQIALQNMERARAWLSNGGDVAIIDATNGSLAQRAALTEHLQDRPVLFVECVNDDPLLLDASIRAQDAGCLNLPG